MHGLIIFYPMNEKIGEDQDRSPNIEESEENYFYKNEIVFENEEDLSNNDKLKDIDQISINEKFEEKKNNSLNHPNKTPQKELPQNIERTENLETTTQLKTEITWSVEEKEILAKIKDLDDKRKKSSDKGAPKNNILKVIKNKCLENSQTILFIMFRKTDLYKKYKINFARIKVSSNQFESSFRELLLKGKTFKELLLENKENEEIIRIIMANIDDYPQFKKILNITIVKLFSFYSDECDPSYLEDEFFLQLNKSYKELIDKKVKEGKSDIYIQSFSYYASHIWYVYKDIKSKTEKAT